MARLKMVQSQIQLLKPQIGLASRPNGAAPRWRDADDGGAFRKTARWQRLRWSILVRDRFTCQWDLCGRVIADTSQLVADHMVPARIDPSRKWDESNLRCLCAACHNGPRQVEERAIYGDGGGGYKV